MSRLIPAALEKRYQAADARLAEVVNRPHSDDNSVRVANRQDLLAAHSEMLAVYTEAWELPALGTGLLFSALFDARSYTRSRCFEIKHELKTLGGES